MNLKNSSLNYNSTIKAFFKGWQIGNFFGVPNKKLQKTSAIFVEHSFRKKTHASDFLIKLLKDFFSLEILYDENWRKGKDAKVKLTGRNDYVFYFQVIPPVDELSKLSKISKIIWFPMYDAVITGKDEKTLNYFASLPLKTVCFSKTLFDLFKKIGFQSIYLQYFVDPREVSSVSTYSDKRVYFWYRRDPINWEYVKNLFRNTNIDSFIIKNDPDPGFKPLRIKKEDLVNYKIEIHHGHLSRKKHKILLDSANIYIAPRSLEGIGIGNLEALSRGQCIVAPNKPTMNEYVKNSENGILYDLEKPKPIDLSLFDKLGVEARLKAKAGFDKWQEEREKLIKFIIND